MTEIENGIETNKAILMKKYKDSGLNWLFIPLIEQSSNEELVAWINKFESFKLNSENGEEGNGRST